jgi:dipeptidyl aminopeptidase/acylaminoacyl peptidase
LGVVDSSMVCIGGHSYGAFMTANLLTHTNFFKAGFACSGAYNRTLTPFGFQTEERNYWQNSELYNRISPFQNAHKMKHPLLLFHGDADNNPGTFTLQSERYFLALKGLGATTKYVNLPHESHGYRGKENLLQVYFEMDNWIKKYVINKEFSMKK